jgi:arginine/lysine/histidine transport system ATP-binding protein
MTLEESRTRPHDRQAPDGPVIAIDGLVKSFGGRVVIDNVDLKVYPGTIVTIIGQSGGGKSTLLRCVNLLERPDRGSIEVAGEPVFAGTRVVCRDLPRLRQSVGMVFQRFNLFPHLTAVENIVLAQVKASGVPAPAAIDTAVRLLRRVHLEHRGLAFPDQMSGGEQQRVAIARALALQPKVLLFDEPTSALDPESTREVLQVMRELSDDGMTMLIVTHEVPFARRISDAVVFLDAGRIIERGSPAEVLDRPTHQRTRNFLATFDDPVHPEASFDPAVDEPDRPA